MIRACDFDWPSSHEPTITTEGVDTFIRYSDGAVSRFPKNFLVEDGGPTDKSIFQMGRNSFIGQNSKVNFDYHCYLEVGHFCSISYSVNFLPGGQHPLNRISTYNFEFINGFEQQMNEDLDLRRTIIIKNDVWIGKNAFISGDTVIGNGAVIGTHCLVTRGKTLENYGIYVGVPAKLLRFRFSENIIGLLNELAWYSMPIEFIKRHAAFFQVDLNKDSARSTELLQELIRLKSAFTFQA